MTSGALFPKRFSKVDALVLPEHPYLSEDDLCYYIGEYTAKGGFRYSDTNSLIFNFKKRLNLRATLQWRYKGEAISRIASTFREAIGDASLKALTFVPVPPSEAKDDPMHDDRMTQMLRAVNPSLNLDIREIVVQTVTTPKSHQSENRLRPDELIELYRLATNRCLNHEPTNIAIVDDVLTAGSPLRTAMKAVLAQRFPSRLISWDS